MQRLALLGLLACGVGCVQSQPAVDTSNPGTPTGPTQATSQAVAYTDLQPFFTTDCFQCHGNGTAFGGYAMNNYQQVMKDVRKGDAASRLVVDTQPSGSMYRYFSGDRDHKADLVFNWVVIYNAQQTH